MYISWYMIVMLVVIWALSVWLHGRTMFYTGIQTAIDRFLESEGVVVINSDNNKTYRITVVEEEVPSEED